MRTNKSSSEPTFHPFPTVALSLPANLPNPEEEPSSWNYSAPHEAPFQPVRSEMMCSTRPLFHYYPINPSGNDPVPLRPCKTGSCNLLSYDPSPVISLSSVPIRLPLATATRIETMVFNLTCDLCPPSRTVNRCSLSTHICYGSNGSDFLRLSNLTGSDPASSVFVS